MIADWMDFRWRHGYGSRVSMTPFYESGISLVVLGSTAQWAGPSIKTCPVNDSGEKRYRLTLGGTTEGLTEEGILSVVTPRSAGVEGSAGAGAAAGATVASRVFSEV